MINITDFDISECGIEVERSEEFIKFAINLGDFISALPLSVQQNDDLINLIVGHVTEAEHSAFIQGFKSAIDVQGMYSSQSGGVV